MVHRRVRGGKYKINYAGQPAPVEVGDELEVNIIDRCPSGDGMSRIRGYVIVVPKAKPRERVKIRVTQVQVDKKTATGQIIQ
ncbi:MAG: TRAM domain-containing protein [Candidatus Bathyarchaeota archaeon]|nr:TRAM domain-containing protein [Candidatus Bathyarchaeota archaeon]